MRHSVVFEFRAQTACSERFEFPVRVVTPPEVQPPELEMIRQTIHGDAPLRQT